jgi:Fe-S cluster assembly protein SufD
MMRAHFLPSWLTYEEKDENFPAWFASIRQKEWEGLLKNGLPKNRDERFKYTDFSFLNNTNFSANKQDASVINHALLQKYRLDHEGSILLVFVNGYFAPSLSDIEKLKAPMKVSGLQEALIRTPELMQTCFALKREGETQKYPFATLNRALCKDGLFIYLPDHYELKAPLHLLSLVSTDLPFMANPNHVILLSPHSQLTVIEEYLSFEEKSYIMNPVMTTLVGQGVQFNHYKIQREGSAAIHLAHHFIHQKKDSHVNLANFSFGGVFSRDECAVYLSEQGASCYTSGFYHLKQKDQYIDHHVDIDHEAPYSESDMLYKGIIEQAGRVVFNGRLHVHQNAQKTVAHQENHHLLLSAHAESYAKPELEIYADDVKCKHGATTGEIDEDALFYLCSRGIAKEKAIEMLFEGFASSVVDRIRDPLVKAHVFASGIEK